MKYKEVKRNMLNEIQQSILSALRFSLFGGKKPKLNNVDVNALLEEAKAQAVFPLVFSVFCDDLKVALTADKYADINSQYFGNLMNTVRVQAEHGELHEIMQEAGIPYVTMKGCASAAYYPEPELRSMGDVDFLVPEEDIPLGIEALEDHGFQRDQYEFTTNQSAYLRPPMTTWEIHKSPSGIPNGSIGDLIRKELSDMIETAILYERDGSRFYVPNKYHHGLILLLHKISHMTTSGIGLRHLCDWAVFESSFSDKDFTEMYERKLKLFGIWRFAQIMTRVCEVYLGAPKHEWAQNSEISPKLLEDIIEDVFSGGNFGHKDENRQREIKYLTDRKKGQLGNKGLVAQAFSSMNEKVLVNHSKIKKYKVLLPVGWIIESGKYLSALAFGKRKNTGTTAMLKEAAKRKKIYSDMGLFDSK